MLIIFALDLFCWPAYVTKRSAFKVLSWGKWHRLSVTLHLSPKTPNFRGVKKNYFWKNRNFALKKNSPQNLLNLFITTPNQTLIEIMHCSRHLWFFQKSKKLIKGRPFTTFFWPKIFILQLLNISSRGWKCDAIFLSWKYTLWRTAYWTAFSSLPGPDRVLTQVLRKALLDKCCSFKVVPASSIFTLII